MVKTIFYLIITGVAKINSPLTLCVWLGESKETRKEQTMRQTARKEKRLTNEPIRTIFPEINLKSRCEVLKSNQAGLMRLGQP